MPTTHLNYYTNWVGRRHCFIEAKIIEPIYLKLCTKLAYTSKSNMCLLLGVHVLFCRFKMGAVFMTLLLQILKIFIILITQRVKRTSVRLIKDLIGKFRTKLLAALRSVDVLKRHFGLGQNRNNIFITPFIFTFFTLKIQCTIKTGTMKVLN